MYFAFCNLKRGYSFLSNKLNLEYNYGKIKGRAILKEKLYNACTGVYSYAMNIDLKGKWVKIPCGPATVKVSALSYATD